jgi:hypothetical protein
MFPANTGKDAPDRPTQERDRHTTDRKPDEVRASELVAPRADQFRITDLQLWIDLSA